MRIMETQVDIPRDLHAIHAIYDVELGEEYGSLQK